MNRVCLSLCAVLLLAITACAQLPPTPEDLQAKRMELAPGKAVIYLVRTKPDLSTMPAGVQLDGQFVGTTYAGTYYRLELSPGRHRLSGSGEDIGAITVDVQPDRIYFVQHTVVATLRAPNPMSFFHPMGEGEGRAAVQRGQLAG